MVQKNGRRGNRVRGREELIVGNGKRRAGKESFLEAENLRGIGRDKLPKVLSVGAETTDIPLDKRHYYTGTMLSMGRP